MRQLVWVAIAVSALQLPARPVQSQDFDCDKAKGQTEKAICASETLRALDEQMGVQYGYARRFQKSEKDEKQLITEQRAWIQARNQCGRDTSCLEEAYRKRITALESQTEAGSNQ